MTRSKYQSHRTDLRPDTGTGSGLDDSGNLADPYMWALRDLERKRAEIDAAVDVILKLRPQLRRRQVAQD